MPEAEKEQFFKKLIQLLEEERETNKEMMLTIKEEILTEVKEMKLLFESIHPCVALLNKTKEN